MAELKAAEIDRYLTRIDRTIRIYLVYGPDHGLVVERCQALAKNSGVDLIDPFSTIHLDMEELANDPGRLADEVNSIGMFGGERLVRISGSTRKDTNRIFSSLLDQPPVDCWVIIEGGDLKKGTGLRKQVETSRHAMAIPCYPDNDAAISRLINQTLVDNNLTINRENENLLRSLLGGDRLASRMELEKLVLYARGESEITEHHIRDIVGDASSLETDKMIDHVAIGRIETLANDQGKLLAMGTSPDMIMIMSLRHFQMLHDIRSQMEKTRKPASTIVQSMKPPLHFSRRDDIIRSLAIWNCMSLGETMTRFHKASLDCRKNQSLASSICATALMATALKARQLAARN